MSKKTDITLAMASVSNKDGSASHGGDDYDPHQHRQIEKPTNNFETLVHLLKCSLGTGILAMPQAFSRAGLIIGIIFTILIGILCTYCLHLLVKCQYRLCKRKHVALLTYPDSLEYALAEGPPSFKKIGRAANVSVNVFLIVYQLGICCVYIVFIASNLKQMVDPYYKITVEVWMLIILGPLIMINCIRNLKVLAPFSTVANILIFVGLAIVVYFLLTLEKSTEELDMWGSYESFPLFFGTMLFALTAVGVVIVLENNMKTPKSFGTPFGVLNVGMSIIVLLYIAIGVIGYVFCVNNCADSITLNLPDTPLAMAVSVLFLIAIFISYALQCYVPVDIVWSTFVHPRILNSKVPAIVWEYGVRIFLCLLTFVLAVLIPRLGLFISLFGALCLSALGLIFPALMDICLRYPRDFGGLRWIFVKDLLILIVGILGLVIGTYTAILAIVKSFL